MQNEQEARGEIDTLLSAEGRTMCDSTPARIHVARALATRSLPRKTSHGFGHHLLYVDRKIHSERPSR
jgi:hypothetical protein